MSATTKTVSLSVQLEVEANVTDEQIAEQAEKVLGGAQNPELKKAAFRSIGKLQITSAPKVDAQGVARGYESRIVEWEKATC